MSSRLARPDRLTRSDLLTRPARLTEFAEDLAQLVVHRLEHGRVLIERQFAEPGQRGDGLVHAGVAGGLGSRHRTFGIHVRYSTHMHSAEECREALEKLAGRLADLKPAERETYFGDRTISVTIPDLGVTYATRLGAGDDPVREASPDDPPADIRLTANSDEVMSLAESPMNIARAWMNGRVKIEASMKDLFRLRKLL